MRGKVAKRYRRVARAAAKEQRTLYTGRLLSWRGKEGFTVFVWPASSRFIYQHLKAAHGELRSA